MEEDAITARIIACAIKVHKALGPGLLESPYQIGLEEEFKQDKIQFKSQLALPLIYNGRITKKGYRVDFLVEERVIVEVKAEKRIHLLDHAGPNVSKVVAAARWPNSQLQHSMDEIWYYADSKFSVSPLS
jgi:GxxExxY protein